MDQLNLIGKKAENKFVPDQVFSCTQDQLRIFLSRLFSCDGTIYHKKSGKSAYWQVSYASKSFCLIKQIQHLLLRFSVLSRIRPRNINLGGKSFLNYELVVYSTKEYLQEIGFFGEKETRQTIALKDLEATDRNPNLDTVPRELWDFYRPKSWASVGRKMNYAHPKSLRESIRYSPSRQKLLQIATFDEREDMVKLAQSDIYWDFITSIEEETGSYTVYDISIPETHNFVANDIIVHNSYTMGAMAEGIASLSEAVAKNIAVLIFDTMGIYWTMKYANQRDRSLLDMWGIQPKGLDIELFVPAGKYDAMVESGIPADKPFSIAPYELEPAQWLSVFGISPTSPEGSLFEEVVADLREGGRFGLDDILRRIEQIDAEKQTKRSITNLIEGAKHWGLFSENATPIKDLVSPGKVSVLDVSVYANSGGAWNLRALVIGLVSQKLFEERMLARKKEEHDALEAEMTYQQAHANADPVVWCLIDEAHEFLPRTGKTPATDALVTNSS